MNGGGDDEGDGEVAMESKGVSVGSPFCGQLWPNLPGQAQCYLTIWNREITGMQG